MPWRSLLPWQMTVVTQARGASQSLCRVRQQYLNIRTTRSLLRTDAAVGHLIALLETQNMHFTRSGASGCIRLSEALQELDALSAHETTRLVVLKTRSG